MNYSDICLMLVNRRQMLGISQRDLATAMGTSQSAISELEAGGNTKMSTLRRWVSALGGTLSVSVDFPEVVVTHEAVSAVFRLDPLGEDGVNSPFD